MKVVVNRCYGGFGLSDAALREYAKRTGRKVVRSTPRYKGDKGYCLITSDLSLPDIITDKQWNDSRGTISRSDFDRNDANLVAVVEKLGEAANGEHARLEIVEVPDGTNFEIEEYDGQEWVSERHRRW